MIDQKYGERMLEFIQNLPDTNVIVVNFDTATPKGARITESLHVMECSTTKKRFLVNCGRAGIWVYTYMPSAITYLFTRIDTDVQSFVGYVSGGGKFDIGSVGSHLSVGLQEKTSKLVLNTHFTTYEEEEQAFQFATYRPMECIVSLHDELNEQSICLYRKGKPSGETFGSVYQDYPVLVKIIHTLRSVYLGDLTSHKGSKGGHYTVGGGSDNKKYIRPTPMQSGFRGQPLTDGILDMIYKHIIKPVANICWSEYKYAISASLFYDTDNIFACKKQNIVLLYDISEHDTRHIFYLDTDKVFAAYEAYNYDILQKPSVKPPSQLPLPSEHARSCMNEFNHLIKMQTAILVA